MKHQSQRFITKRTGGFRRPPIIGVAAVSLGSAGLILLLSSIWVLWSFRSFGVPTVTATPKELSEQRVRDTLHVLSPDGVVVYAAVNEYCTDRDRICGYSGTKLIRGKGSIAKDLEATETALRTAGLERISYPVPNDYDQELQGAGGSGEIRYSGNGQPPLWGHIGYFSGGGGVSRPQTARDFFQVDKDLPPLQPGEYFYGIHIYSSYFEKRGGGLLGD